MQNVHCRGKVIDKIYFLVSYMPIWSFWGELVQLEPYMVGRSDSNEHINKKPEVCHLSTPLPTILINRSLQRHSHLGQFMAIIWFQPILQSGCFKDLHMNGDIRCAVSIQDFHCISWSNL